MRRRFQISGDAPDEESPTTTSIRSTLPAWLIGIVAAAACLWLAHLGTIWLLPAVLIAGLLALRSGPNAEWLWWVPGIAVATAAFDVLAPLTASRWGNLHHVELVAIAVVVLGLVRAIGWAEEPRSRTPVDRPIAALLGLYAATLLLPGGETGVGLLARDAMTTAVVFYATVQAANRGGARWAWLAFPAAAGLAGLFAAWGAFRDPKSIVDALAQVDAAWRTTGGLWFVLLVSVPLGFGVAMKADPPVLRHLCTVLVNLGVMGAIAMFFAGARPAVTISLPDRLPDLLRAMLLAGALAGLAGYAEWNRRHQPEPARWLALAVVFSVCAAGLLMGMPLGGPVRLLLAIAAGLVIGVPSAEARLQPVAVPTPREAAPETPQPAPIPALVRVPVKTRPFSAQTPVAIPKTSVAVAPQSEFHPQTLISVVIVAHRALDALGPCLSSLSAARLTVPMEVVVVDNNSGDGTLDWIRREHPWVGTIASATDVGFARGVNLGVTEACGDLLLLLNPHCEVSAEALEAMCELAARTPSLAAVAPMLLDGRGRLTRSCGRFPDLWMLACEHFGLTRLFPRSRVFAGYQYGDRPLDSLGDVDWATGACLLIPRAVWESVGTLDESMFLYLEEVDWCRRAARTGRQVRFVPAARVVHHGSLASKPAPGDSYDDDLRSSVLYFRKHDGPLAAAIAKAVLMTSLVIKWGASSMRVTSRPLATIYARGVSTVWMA